MLITRKKQKTKTQETTPPPNPKTKTKNKSERRFQEILSLYLDGTAKPWVGSLCFLSLVHLKGTVREGLLYRLSVTAALGQ